MSVQDKAYMLDMYEPKEVIALVSCINQAKRALTDATLHLDAILNKLTLIQKGASI